MLPLRVTGVSTLRHISIEIGKNKKRYVKTKAAYMSH
jgi:hypothetical protein